MNRITAVTNGKRHTNGIVVLFSKRLLSTLAVSLVAIVPALPQNAELQEKLAAVKQVAAENKQKLHQYQWIETTQLTLKGNQKPPTHVSTALTGKFKRPHRPSPGTTQRWQDEGKNHREEKSGNEGLHARRQGRSGHVCAA